MKVILEMPFFIIKFSNNNSGTAWCNIFILPQPSFYVPLSTCLCFLEAHGNCMTCYISYNHVVYLP